MKTLVSSTLAVLILVASASIPVVAPARTVQKDHARSRVQAQASTLRVEQNEPVNRAPTGPTESRDNEFNGWWHDAGELRLHTSNYGFIGDWNSAPGEPSAEWPAGSSSEHLFCAGLWVGARVGPDTLVTAAVYGMEFLAPAEDPLYTIYESASGAPGGAPDFDDDSDGRVDEDRLDGIDNDLDGAVDEDYAAISDEMFACVYFDTAEIDHVPPVDPHTPIGLEVYETSYAWSAPCVDDFVVMRYEITNIGQDTLRQAYLGLMVDPDIGAEPSAPIYVDDRVAYLDKEVPEAPAQERVRLQMADCWDEPDGPDGNWYGHIGFAVLDHPTDPDGIAAPAYVGPIVFHVWCSATEDPHRDAKRYRYMSEPRIDRPTTTAQDWRFLLSVGPFDRLAPGETTYLEVAVVCGEGARGLVENASAIYCRLENASILRQLDEPSDRSEDGEPKTRTLSLAPPAPNPARASTRVAFALPERGPVRLSVLSPGGRLVATLVDGERGPGEHAEVWDGGTDSGAWASSGVYVVSLKAGGQEAFRKLVLIR